MITQYAWASVKKQQRRYIEIGMMLTLTLAISVFYSLPQFGTAQPVVEAYTPPPIDVISIPATQQPPQRVKPIAPPIVIPGEVDPDIDPVIDWKIELTLDDFSYLAPPAVDDPVVPIWEVQEPPEPIGGYASILRNISYPEVAREAGIEGRVIVEAVIGKDGFVKEVTILEGIPRTGLNDAAMEAIWLTQFTPAYQMGKPVSVRLSIPIVFRLR